MPTRVGIELTPSRCSIVSVEPLHDTTRIREFRTIEYTPGDFRELESALRRLWADVPAPPRAQVVLWDARAVHLYLHEAARSVPDRRRWALDEARRSVPESAQWIGDSWSAVVPVGSPAVGSAPEVMHLFVAVSAEDGRRLLQPLLRAGCVVETVTTPALALAGLAELEPGSDPRKAVGYLALNLDCGALAVVGDRRLLVSRGFRWEYRRHSPSEHGRVAERYAFAANLAPELKAAFGQVGELTDASVAYVVSCGDFPQLRSLSMPLIKELDLEVGTLDSLDGIDPDQLPEPANQFREQVAALRLAWVAGVDLAPLRVVPQVVAASGWQTDRRVWTAAAAVAAVLLLLVLWPFGSSVPRQQTWVVAAPEAQRPQDSAGRAAAESPGSPDVARPQPERSAATPPEPQPADSFESTEKNRGDVFLRAQDASANQDTPESLEAAGAGPPEAVPVEPSVPEEVAAPQGATSAAAPPGRLPPAEPRPQETAPDPAPTAQAPPAAAQRPVPAGGGGGAAASSAASENSGRPAAPVAPSGDRPAQSAQDEVAEEFEEPVVRSILFSSERRLAIVDNQIVGIGDTVGPAEVVDITRDAVVFQLPSGARRRVPLRAPVATPRR